jgi:hypothetical protein
MSSFIFVSVICMANACTFFTSKEPITENKCNAAKQEFLANKFNLDVTLAAAQCMPFIERVQT